MSILPAAPGTSRTFHPLALESGSARGRPQGRKRISDDKPYLPPPYVEFPIGVSTSELDGFLREQRLIALTEKLERRELEIPEKAIRSQSPPPVYDRAGRRLNTIEDRVKTDMMAEWNRLIYHMTKTNPNFVPPATYRPPRFQKRLFIPVDKFPRHNLAGLVIGPRGSTLARLRSDSGCEVGLRGQGSRNRQSPEEADMAMHVFIEGESEEMVLKAISMVEPLIDPLHPEHELARLRSYETLALITGTSLQETLGEQQYKRLEGDIVFADEGEYERPDIVCSICGDRGHPAADCRVGRELEFETFLRDVGAAADAQTAMAQASTEDERMATIRQRIGAAQITSELAANVTLTKGKKSNFHPLSFQASAVQKAQTERTRPPPPSSSVDVVSLPPWKRPRTNERS